MFLSRIRIEVWISNLNLNKTTSMCMAVMYCVFRYTVHDLAKRSDHGVIYHKL